MAALEYLPNIEADNVNEIRVSKTRYKLAGVLFDIPEPAAQTAALQLLKGKISLDKSFAIFLGLIGMAILEEMI